MFSSTITQTSYKVKEYIYLVLKKKPFIQQIFDDVKEEADKRFNLLIQTKINLLQGVKPDNPQTFLECFLLRGLPLFCPNIPIFSLFWPCLFLFYYYIFDIINSPIY